MIAKNTNLSVPWVEKYRPRSLDEISYQDEVISALQNVLTTQNLPHLLLYGPPGTGKTSTILALARQLFGPIVMKSRVLELNASHERGIDVIREKVKVFAQIAISKVDSDPNYPCPNFKIIIQDEADNMTNDAQSSQRRIIEQYTKVTRFCIICNYISKIIEPIVSRCAKFRYSVFSPETLRSRIETIVSKENVNINNQVQDTLLQVCDTDMRRCITVLQTCHRFCSSKDTQITTEQIHDIAGTVPSNIITNLFDCCTNTKTTWDILQNTVQDILSQGYCLNSLLSQFHHIVLSSSLSDTSKANIGIKIGETEQALLNGADEYILLQSFISYVFSTINEDNFCFEGYSNHSYN